MSLPEVAARFTETILTAVQREYPNALRHTMDGPDDRPTPSQVHPAFYGCYDWHSAVEMHWALVRLLRLVPSSVPAADIRGVLDAHLNAAAIAAETSYFLTRPGFERPYGWSGCWPWPPSLRRGTTRTPGGGQTPWRRWQCGSPRS